MELERPSAGRPHQIGVSMHEIRDPIHGTVSFTARERAVVDHPFVQRLRHVRQLGLVSLVYPGATHDRFSHCLGAMCVVSRVWERIMETSGDVLRRHFEDFDLEYFHRLLRLAGLLHDIGHPPFSHMAESLMPKVGELELPDGWFGELDPERRAKHEDYSVLLIGAMSEGDSSPLPPDEAQDIASLVHYGVSPSPSWEKRYGGTDSGQVGIHRLLSSLISGELDCDRMDYLLRDAHFTGVAYGTFDMDHLIGNLGVTESGGILLPTVDSTAVRAFEDFLLARYHMFLQVYLHKTALGFDRFLERAVAEGEISLTIPTDAASFVRLRDSTVTEALYSAAERVDGWSRRLVTRIPARSLFRASNGNEEDRAIMSRLVKVLERRSVPFFRIDSRQYLSSSGGSFGGGSGLLVRRKMFGRIAFEPMERYSELLNKYNEIIDLSGLYVLCENALAAQRAMDELGWPIRVGMSGGKQSRFL
ncbi:MAG: hypothetical protein AUJ19_04155 [Parcubacteria group bacterium CG1_02_58_44]|nr:MAG: hypothetical protein AUJ19_04155 [Parcubacteria group bacterium CG1_02_58_44]